MALVPTGQATPADAGAPSPADAHAGHAEAPGERKVLFYRSPMDPSITSPVPAQDQMGMDFVPVYADEQAEAASAVPGLAALAISAEGLRLAGVQTSPAVRERISRSVRTVGSVVPDERRIRHVHTKIAGWVEKLYVSFTGQLVRQGEPILSIYSQELVATQEELLRAKETAGRFAGSELPEVRRGGEDLLRAARRRLELYDVPQEFVAELERTSTVQRAVTLLAPVSGSVTAKDVFEGQQVEPGMELFTITDLSHLWVEADFYEYEAAALRVGEQATVGLPYDPTVRLTGRIAFIYPTLELETRTLKVRFEFANPDLVLKPGMFANVELAVDDGEGIVIPDSALMDTGERQVVFVRAEGDTFVPRQVQVGVRSQGKVRVLSGLSEGEQVVIRANFLLDSESRLRAAIAGMGAAGHQHGGGP
jgi:RND family efflux transporter MFP subunit